MKDVMDAFTETGIHRVVVKCCAQVGKSEALLNVLGRFAHVDPCNTLILQPTVDMAQDFSKTRIAPMIRDTKVLNSLFCDVASRDANNTILSKIFPGGRLIMCGANSPAGLASRPIRVLLCDEVDRFPDSAGTEGDPVDLAAKRMTTFWNRVMGLFSTPTNEGSSRIDEEYMAGTQEEWQHRCPNCGEYHKLLVNDMHTDADQAEGHRGKKTFVVHSVTWRCPDCGFSFSERDMKAAPQKYVAHNLDARKNGCRSFSLNAFSSPWISWTEIMREWLEAQGDPEREKVVKNTRFGESYKQAGAFADEVPFLRRREKYGAELPEGVKVLTAAVDTQDNRLEYEVCGWGRDEESWGIFKGIILGKPDQARTWQELDEVLDRVYHYADGTGLKILRTFIDSGGHYSSAVLSYCMENFTKQRFAIKGMGGPGIPLIHKISPTKGYGNIPLVILGVNDGKQQIMNALAVEAPGPRYAHFPKDEEAPLNHRGYDDLYFKGIISEHKKRIKHNGIIKEIWDPTQGVRNEPLDLRNYNLACLQSLEIDWDKLEGVEPVQGVKESAPKKRTKKARKAYSQTSIW